VELMSSSYVIDAVGGTLVVCSSVPRLTSCRAIKSRNGLMIHRRSEE